MSEKLCTDSTYKEFFCEEALKQASLCRDNVCHDPPPPPSCKYLKQLGHIERIWYCSKVNRAVFAEICWENACIFWRGYTGGPEERGKKKRKQPRLPRFVNARELTFVRVHLVACADGCERARGRMTAFDGRAIYLWISLTASLITAVAPH